jgi:hypothetical protein
MKIFSIGFTILLTTLFAASARAEQLGSISGSVIDAEGKAAVGLALRLEQVSHISVKPPGGNLKHKTMQPLQTKPAAPPVATATTDAQGKFSMTQIKPGSYRLVGGNNSIGWIFQDVTVEAGKEIKLDLKLVAAKK